MTLTNVMFGGREYVSYASLDEADKILNADPTRRGVWNALAVDDRLLYLIAATQRLDLLMWAGSKASDNQANAWPRTGLEGVEDDAIPLDLERATALLAGSIAIRPAQADQGTSAQNISRVRAGSVEIDYFRHADTVDGQPLQDETAFVLIRKWLAGFEMEGAFVSGTDGVSSFTDPDKYGLSVR